MALNNILDKQAQQQIADLYSKNANPSAADIGNIVKGAAERNSKAANEQKQSNENLQRSTNALSDSQSKFSASINDAEKGLSDATQSITGIAKSFQTFTSPLEKFKDSLSNIGKSISLGFKNPGRTAMKALNIGGIFNKAIAKSEFNETQRELGNENPDFEAANRTAKKIQANEKAIEEFKKKTGLSDKQIAQTKTGGKLLSDRADLANQFKNYDFSAKIQEPEDVEEDIEDDKKENETVKAAKDSVNIEKQQLKESKETNKILKNIEELLGDGVGGESGGGGFWSSLASGAMSLFGMKGAAAAGTGAAGTAGTGAAAAGTGAATTGFLAANAGTIATLGGVGVAGYTGYKAYQSYKEADEQLEKGEITEDEADVKKTGAVGQGVTGVGGALVGAKAGAALGSLLGPVGTIAGGLLGAGIGAFAGSKLGKGIGEWGAKTWKGLTGKSDEEEMDLTEDQKQTGKKTFREFDLAKNDKELYDEYLSRKSDLQKQAKQKLLGDRDYDSLSPRQQLVIEKQSANMARRQASDEFAVRASKVGAADIHDGTDYYERKEQSYNKDMESKKDLSIMLDYKNRENQLLGKEGVSDDEYTELQKIASSGKSGEWIEKQKAKLEKMKKGREKFKNILSPDSDSFASIAPGVNDKGETINNASSDAEMAKLNAQKGETNVVNAPTTTNVSNQNNNNVISSAPRNEESSIGKYLGNLWTM